MEAELSPLIDPEKNDKDQRRLPFWLYIVLRILGVKTSYHSTCPNTKGKLEPKRNVCFLPTQLIPFTLTAASGLTVTLYLICYFGKTDHFLIFLSFLCYWMSLMSTQIMCTIASFRNDLTNFVNITNNGIHWTCVFHGGVFLSNFSSISSVSKKTPPKFAVFVFFILFALSVSTIRVAFFAVTLRDCRYWFDYVWTVVDVLNVSFFAFFCYYLYLQRIMLEIKAHSTFLLIGENIGNLEICIQQVQNLFRDYLQLRRVLLPWLRMILFSSSFGLTVFFTWNYNEIKDSTVRVITTTPPTEDFNWRFICLSTCDKTPFLKDQNILFVFNILVLSRETMLLCLTLVVVKGLDVLYIWECFRMRLKFSHTGRDIIFWKNLMRFVEDLHPSTSGDMIFSFVVPLLGLASGILGNEHF